MEKKEKAKEKMAEIQRVTKREECREKEGREMMGLGKEDREGKSENKGGTTSYREGGTKKKRKEK